MKTLLTTLIASGILAFGSAANAVVYHLTESNSWDTDGSVVYATVTIVEEGEDIRFTVDPQQGAFESTLTNFGLQAFSFDYDLTVLGTDPVETLDGTNIGIADITPSGWTVTSNSGGRGGFGKFDFDLTGTGQTRADPLTFLITGVENDVVDNYSIYFAGHIADFTSTEWDCVEGDCTSAWFAGAGDSNRNIVPIPAAAWLFGSGLIGLVGVARRKVTDNNA